MKKSLIISFFILSILCTGILPSYAWKLHFKKKQKIIPPKMVETKAEWLEKSQCIPLNERKFEPIEAEQNEKLARVSPPHVYIRKYNVPAGGNEVNISKIKKQHISYSEKIASPNFEKAIISYYYFSPNQNQISSELFLIPLDTTKTRTKRLIDAPTIDYDKGSNLTSGVYEFRKNYFKTLTLVDWSYDNKYILVKEKIGSSDSGIFRTNVIGGKILEDDIQYIKYEKLNDKIIEYNKKNNKILLNNYRWDIKILGFHHDENYLAVIEAICWDKNGQKQFLNLWGVNLETGKIKLISNKPTPVEIQANGFGLEFTYE